MTYIYLASPYSHTDPAVVEARFEEVLRVTAELFMKGLSIFSPIVHCHPLAKRHTLPTDAAFWQQYNRAMIRSARVLAILTLEDWGQSIGVRKEILYATHRAIPRVYIPPALEERHIGALAQELDKELH